jgi:hypothetical protein
VPSPSDALPEPLAGVANLALSVRGRNYPARGAAKITRGDRPISGLICRLMRASSIYTVAGRSGRLNLLFFMIIRNVKKPAAILIKLADLR